MDVGVKEGTFIFICFDRKHFEMERNQLRFECDVKEERREKLNATNLIGIDTAPYD